MPPSNSQIRCPNCGQPVAVPVQQIFDLAQDPNDKQLLLSGAVNFINCPHCGYQGDMATPLVFHDPKKELLLVHVPAELGLSRADQERSIGRLINQVIDRLPQEQRKGYLLSPQNVLTTQGLIERVLEEDGITKEMIQAQQQRLKLIQRLLTASPESREEIARQEDELLDAEFFTLLGQLQQASARNGDQRTVQELETVQRQILPLSSFGRDIQQQTREVEAAAQSLQELGSGLTRQKLLDLAAEAPNETRLRALAGLARQGMDYEFFQILSDRIDQAEPDQKEKLLQLREKLLQLTGEIDEQIEARLMQARQLLKAITRSANIEDATLQNLEAVDDFFVQVLNSELEAAQRANDRDRLDRLERVIEVLQRASGQPPELELIQTLIEAPDDETRQRILEGQPEEITTALLETLTALLSQAQSSGDTKLLESLRATHRLALRISMRANLQR